MKFGSDKTYNIKPNKKMIKLQKNKYSFLLNGLLHAIVIKVSPETKNKIEGENNIKKIL
ncbi:hypothetical protein ONR65_00375 [Proteus mirabilis]|uniref:hypothetical protein n=1 Tax=Proteus mirabilis TaxID=584 RepID=UPI002230A585|nr:hypothetical protein [Proteus mirabilis]UZE78298.1 hypothetical protein ONR65_00375 [Proteus mirabilis]